MGSAHFIFIICGLMQLKEDVREYWDLRSNGFSDAVNFEIDTNADQTRPIFQNLLEVKPGMSALDIGCGPGAYTIILAEMGLSVTGIDYSEKMLEKAVENTRHRNICAEFIKMDAQHLEFEDNSFDIIVSRDVFWNLDNPEAAYSELIRVLKPGGKALVADGNYYLHLYNNAYRKSKSGGSHTAFNKDNVDFKIIENLAHDLPLSKVSRPQWDIDVLGRLNCSKVQILFSPNKNTSQDSRRIIMGFKLIITKEELNEQ